MERDLFNLFPPSLVQTFTFIRFIIVFLKHRGGACCKQESIILFLKRSVLISCTDFSDTLPRSSLTLEIDPPWGPLIAKTLFTQHVDRMYSVLVSDMRLVHHACTDMSKLDLLPRVYNPPIQEFITVDSTFA